MCSNKGPKKEYPEVKTKLKEPKIYQSKIRKEPAKTRKKKIETNIIPVVPGAHSSTNKGGAQSNFTINALPETYPQSNTNIPRLKSFVPNPNSSLTPQTKSQRKTKSLTPEYPPKPVLDPDLIPQLESLTFDNTRLFSFSNTRLFCRVVSVYDGDTLHIAFPYKGENIKLKCRCLGYDSPELRTKNLDEKQKGIEARDYLKSLILGKIVDTYIDKYDKYGRLLVEIWVPGTDRTLSNIMVEKNHGIPYDGTGTKASSLFVKS